MSGDCFQVAFRLQAEDDSLTLVHGLAIGSGPENQGKRFWHAWVERTVRVECPGWPHPVDVVTVIDRANGNDVELPQAFYYHVGRIDPALTYRYTRDVAARIALRTRHFGPWADAPCEVVG